MEIKEIAEINKFYPDIVRSGGLSNAINESLRKIGSKLQVMKCDNNMIVYNVRIENKERFSHVTVVVNERKFLVDLWNEGIWYGNWCLNDLDQVSDFIMKSIELRFPVKKLEKLYPWFNSKKGKIHEKGVKYETKHQWNELKNNLKNEKTQKKYLLPCFKIAKKMNELKELFPFTSHNTLCFSLTTGYPFLEVGPKITVLKENHFEIRFDEKEVKEIFSVKDIRNYIKQNIKYYGNVRQGTALYIE
jgi:hypothetical protein